MTSYSLLDVHVTTPTVELRGAADDLLDELAAAVRAGKTHADPAPYDDPMSLYESDPDAVVDNHGSNAISRALVPSATVPRLDIMSLIGHQSTGVEVDATTPVPWRGQ